MRALKVQYFRGQYLESEHQVDVVVSDANGPIHVFGDSQLLYFPRSSVKMLQALLFARATLKQDLNVDLEKKLAIACGSHRGESYHVELVQKWLKELSLSPNDLVCGAHPPFSEEAQKALATSQQKADKTHNNCSGKHTAFLNVCQLMGWSTQGYEQADHPLQRELHKLFLELAGEADFGYGIDGCGIPNFRMSLAGCARAMTYFLDKSNQDAQRILQSLARNPDWISGHESFNSELIRLTEGQVTLKGGAEGTYAGVFLDKQWTFALKTHDGSNRAVEPILWYLMEKWGILETGSVNSVKKVQFKERFYPQVKTWSGEAVGLVVVS